MIRKYVIMGLALATFAACSPKEEHNEEEAVAETVDVEEEVAVADSTKFGVEVAPEAAITLASLDEKIATATALEDVTVTGKVTEVCQQKGCWMKLEKADGSEMRVKFKDYALFMPKDLAGKEVVIHGVASMDTVAVDVLKHYAEDAGKTEEEIAAITEPELALAFEADGVLIK
ncbi:DUF4920 domain-containing protein [Flammeovirgaceae bacterium SG7u.111]|nr:DUF4920 domain-containing protein [Flammeovirgaceae bacterium SG7u.132]WPO35125.1 DUF4920 domain-containing protein [Flammeovirgaceae bacterium SG7u.111]